MPDVLSVVEVDRQEGEQKKAVIESVQEALKALEKMRQSEGARLGKDIAGKGQGYFQCGPTGPSTAQNGDGRED